MHLYNAAVDTKNIFTLALKSPGFMFYYKAWYQPFQTILGNQSTPHAFKSVPFPCNILTL